MKPSLTCFLMKIINHFIVTFLFLLFKKNNNGSSYIWNLKFHWPKYIYIFIVFFNELKSLLHYKADLKLQKNFLWKFEKRIQNVDHRPKFAIWSAKVVLTVCWVLIRVGAPSSMIRTAVWFLTSSHSNLSNSGFGFDSGKMPSFVRDSN